MGNFFNSLRWQIVVLAALIGGCAVTPTTITTEEYTQQLDADLAMLFADQDPLEGPLGLYEALARAIKYNLDHRLKLMEDALSLGQLEVDRYNMLPELVADAGYDWRSNYSGASSKSLLTGAQSLEPSTSAERNFATANITMVWNVLDFGVSYIHAQQQADQALISNERRRKVMQNIVQDVRYAYWRAVSAERLLPKMDALLQSAYAALQRAKMLEKLQLQPPLQALNYQKALLEVIRQMWMLRQDLATAKTELSALINLKPGTRFELADTGLEQDELPAVLADLEELEELALKNRPELIEEHYQARIAALEVKKAMRRMLPGLELTLGGFYDGNSYVYNGDWVSAGYGLSWNLMKLFSGPADIRLARTQQSVDELRRLSLSMAIVTQVHLAYQRFQIARKSYAVSSDMMTVETRIQEQLEAQQRAQTGNELEKIRSEASALAIEMQRDLGYAELQNAFGQLHNSLGVDPGDIETLVASIEARLNAPVSAGDSLDSTN
ncbi:MAG: TolC family protein [Gammaproteobacteria bacterium]